MRMSLHGAHLWECHFMDNYYENVTSWSTFMRMPLHGLLLWECHFMDYYYENVTWWITIMRMSLHGTLLWECHYMDYFSEIVSIMSYRRQDIVQWSLYQCVVECYTGVSASDHCTRSHIDWCTKWYTINWEVMII